MTGRGAKGNCCGPFCCGVVGGKPFVPCGGLVGPFCGAAAPATGFEGERGVVEPGGR